MFDFIARVLAGLYELPVVGGNYGLAIILLTLAVMVLLMPLTLRATRSTIKMQQVQPELKRIQKELKGDREKMNEELMKLYSENGINPIGGCVPMLAQLPVFLVLFNVLRGLTRRISEVPWFDVSNQILEASGSSVVNAENFDPKYLSHDSDMYVDLSQTDTMSFGPFDLAEKASDVLRDNFVTALPYIALIIFVVGSSYYQQRQVSARRTDDPNATVSPVMQQQQMLLKVLPLMSGVWSFLFPAGLVLYWATSNLFRIGQQAYITHQIYGKEGATEKLAAVKAATATTDSSDSSEKSEKKAPKKADKPSTERADTKTASKESASDKAASKAEAWEKRRAEKAKAKKSSSGPSTSSRVTPKGTAPSRSKKKRKR